MSQSFASIATELAAKFGNVIPASVLTNTCSRRGVKIPADVVFRRGIRRGGNYDVSAYILGNAVQRAALVAEPDAETFDEVPDALTTTDRFEALDTIGHGIVHGDFHALIASGNPGIGKTYTLERILSQAERDGKIKKYTPIHGYSRATGVYRTLFENKEPGMVVLFDDCDNIFDDMLSLNILKAALDTTHVRIISWHSEKAFKDEDGELLPHSFQFEGSVIFVTNINFEQARGGKLGPHLDALMSRSYYLNLNMKNQEELLERIDNVTRNSSLLTDVGVPKTQAPFLLKYIRDNKDNLREMSLRTVVKLAAIHKASKSEKTFYTIADATLCRKGKKRT